MRFKELAKSINDRLNKDEEKYIILVNLFKIETATRQIEENLKEETTTRRQITVEIPVDRNYMYAENAEEYFSKTNEKEMHHIFIPTILITISAIILHVFSNWQWITKPNTYLVVLFSFMAALCITIPVGIIIRKRAERLFKKYNPDPPMSKNEKGKYIENHPEIVKWLSQGFEIYEELY